MTLETTRDAPTADGGPDAEMTERFRAFADDAPDA